MIDDFVSKEDFEYLTNRKPRYDKQTMEEIKLRLRDSMYRQFPVLAEDAEILPVIVDEEAEPEVDP